VENVWVISALWIGLALVSALISIRVGISVALIEIVVGGIGGNLLGIAPNDWITYLASLGAILLTFLAGTELDPVVVRKHLGATLSIGVAGFFLPYLGVLAYAHYVLDWPWPQAQIAGIALSTTSVAVVYAVMLEFGFNATDYGKTVLAACFITDLGTVVGLGLIFAPFTLCRACSNATAAGRRNSRPNSCCCACLAWAPLRPGRTARRCCRRI
jgi:Kef-type K+ transport system membrane component KefB